MSGGVADILRRLGIDPAKAASLSAGWREVTEFITRWVEQDPLAPIDEAPLGFPVTAVQEWGVPALSAPLAPSERALFGDEALSTGADLREALRLIEGRLLAYADQVAAEESAFPDLASTLSEAATAHRAGMYRAGSVTAAVVVDGLTKRLFDASVPSRNRWPKYREKIEFLGAHQVRALHSAERGWERYAVLLALSRFLEMNEEAPHGFNRHVLAHALDGSFATIDSTTSIGSIWLASALLENADTWEQWSASVLGKDSAA